MKPVDALRRDIETKDGGNMEPIDAGGLPRELQPIAVSGNLLMQRLRTALDAEREFTSNGAHELRTPIAGALAQTQMLISELQAENHRNRAGQIEASLRRLGHLAEKLLQLSRAEAGIGITDRQADLTPVIDNPERLRLRKPPAQSLPAPIARTPLPSSCAI